MYAMIDAEQKNKYGHLKKQPFYVAEWLFYIKEEPPGQSPDGFYNS
jgi:hypothetical protein